MGSRKQAIEKYNEGKIQSSLNIVKNFRLGVTKEDRDVMQTGYECFKRPESYTQMGYNVEECTAKAVAVLERVLNITNG